jgi:hypothetical protein
MFGTGSLQTDGDILLQGIVNLDQRSQDRDDDHRGDDDNPEES